MMNSSPNILFIDDDPEIRGLTSRFLIQYGMNVSTAASGVEADEVMSKSLVDLIVTDVMMPGEDGLAITRRLRGKGVSIPIILLTALGEDTDRIIGLEMGADDYLAKPFNPRELLARIKAVLRRTVDAKASIGPSSSPAGQTCHFGGWSLSLSTRDLISPDGIVVVLSSGEFDLLKALIDHPRRILSRDQLLDMARGRNAVPFDRSIDIQISRLRRKLNDDAKEPQIIKTVRGGGYLFTPGVEIK